MKCDELKAFNCVESDLQEFCEPRLVYLKSEADKVIARHKYKRCLAMAKWCFTKSNYHYILARHGEDVKKNNRKSILYSRWRRRWLEIATKFKEAK